MNKLIFEYRKQLIIILILLIGLAFSVILVQKTQIFKSRASAEGLAITSPDGQPVYFKETTDQTYYETEADSIQFSAQDIEVLKR